MRKLLNALAGGAVVIMLSAPAAHAASPAIRPQQQHQSQIERHHRDDDRDWRDDRDDDGDGDWGHYHDHDHWRRCHHGIVDALVHWLI